MSDEGVVSNLQPRVFTPPDEKVVEAAEATFAWLCQQSGDFFRPYAGMWIAAQDCRIIASGMTMDDLLARVGNVDLRTVLLHRVERPGKVIYQCNSPNPG